MNIRRSISYISGAAAWPPLTTSGTPTVGGGADVNGQSSGSGGGTNSGGGGLGY